MTLHQARWETVGQPGAFANERVRRFHAALVDQWVPAGRLALARVTSPQGLVGLRYAYVDGDRVLGYQTGWAPSADPRVSPGVVLQHAVLEEARRRGYRWWDYLSGTSELKQRLSTGSYPLVWAAHLRPDARGLAVRAVRTGRSLLRATTHALAVRKAPEPS
jgi:CelD/BcsL family acetyltransferase involved in cellulose biosynthesis